MTKEIHGHFRYESFPTVKLKIERVILLTRTDAPYPRLGFWAFLYKWWRGILPAQRYTWKIGIVLDTIITDEVKVGDVFHVDDKPCFPLLVLTEIDKVRPRTAYFQSHITERELITHADLEGKEMFVIARSHKEG